MKRIAILTAALLLAGCSSFRLGAVCYLPHGMGGECRIIPVPAAASVPAPAASGVSV